MKFFGSVVALAAIQGAVSVPLNMQPQLYVPTEDGDYVAASEVREPSEAAMLQSAETVLYVPTEDGNYIPASEVQSRGYSFVQTAETNLPAPTQDHEGTGKSLEFDKFTPGEGCYASSECETCTATAVCVWLSSSGSCVESRDRAKGEGTRSCTGPYTSEIMDEADDETDDFASVDIDTGSLTTIASLKSGEDVYAVADDASEKRGFARGGLELENPASAGEYEGGVAESDEQFESRKNSPGNEGAEREFTGLQKATPAEETVDNGPAAGAAALSEVREEEEAER